MSFPYVFANLSGQIPLSYLDDNFNRAAMSGANNDITSLAALVAVPSVVSAAIASSNVSGFANKLINGSVSIDQRNTASVPVNASGSIVYGPDRYAIYALAPSGTLTGKKAPGDLSSQYCLRLSKTAGNYASGLWAFQTIESLDAYALSGKAVTLSFRARVGSTFTGSTAVGKAIYTGIGNDEGAAGGVGGSWTGWAAPTLTAVSNPALNGNFQTYSFTATLSASTTEIMVGLSMACSASAGSANDYIEFTDIQLEIGSIATAFATRPYGLELSLCQRYYYRMFPGVAAQVLGGSYNISANQAIAPVKLPVRMRTSPTALEQDGTATDYSIYAGGSEIVCNAVPAFYKANTDYASTTFTVVGGLTTGQAGECRTATATTAGYLGWSAEL